MNDKRRMESDKPATDAEERSDVVRVMPAPKGPRLSCGCVVTVPVPVVGLAIVCPVCGKRLPL